MLIEEKALEHWIHNFYGYGSWDARFWFVGYEESGGNTPAEVADKLNYFYNVHRASMSSSLCEVRELYRQVAFQPEGPKAGLFTNLFEYRFGPNAIQHGAWKNLIAFEHGYNNEVLPDLLAYQKNSFGHQEALIPLYPLPSPHNHAWYYSWLDLPQSIFLQTRTTYQEHVYPSRIRQIFHNITVYKPNVVLMYGMDNITQLKKSVQEFFRAANFKTFKAIKMHLPQYHRLDLDGTILLITTQIPTLRHNRIETGFDWQELGRVVKSQNEM